MNEVGLVVPEANTHPNVEMGKLDPRSRLSLLQTLRRRRVGNEASSVSAPSGTDGERCNAEHSISCATPIAMLVADDERLGMLTTRSTQRLEGRRWRCSGG